mgnify:FL=1
MTGTPCQTEDMEEGTYYFAVVANTQREAAIFGTKEA